MIEECTSVIKIFTRKNIRYHKIKMRHIQLLTKVIGQLENPELSHI